MAERELIDWAIQVEQELQRRGLLFQEAKESRAKLYDLLTGLKELLSRNDVSHEHILVKVKEIRQELNAILDLQIRVRLLEHRSKQYRRQEHVRMWTPIAAAIASAILAAAAYYFPSQ